MFRLPFAAGRVFSISMLDTLLYQVSRVRGRGGAQWEPQPPLHPQPTKPSSKRPSWVLAEQHMLAPGVPHSPTLGSPWVSNPF